MEEGDDSCKITIIEKIDLLSISRQKTDNLPKLMFNCLLIYFGSSDEIHYYRKYLHKYQFGRLLQYLTAQGSFVLSSFIYEFSLLFYKIKSKKSKSCYQSNEVI